MTSQIKTPISSEMMPSYCGDGMEAMRRRNSRCDIGIKRHRLGSLESKHAISGIHSVIVRAVEI